MQQDNRLAVDTDFVAVDVHMQRVVAVCIDASPRVNSPSLASSEAEAEDAMRTEKEYLEIEEPR